MPYSGSRNTPYSHGEPTAIVDIELDRLSDVQLVAPVEDGQHLAYNAGVWTNEYTQKTFVRVRNETGVTITKGSVVHVNDVQNANVVKVVLADASDPIKMPAIGIVLDNILNNENGLAVSYGRADGVDTTGFALGETLYVSNVAGQVINVKPLATTDKIQNIGVCIKVGTNGSVFVTGIGRANDIPNAEILPDDTTVDYVYVNTAGNDLKKIDPLLLNTKVPNLQAVTDVGSVTTNDITVNTLNITNPVSAQTSSLIYYDTVTDATSYGALPNLQQITDVGSVTTNSITASGLTLSPNFTITESGGDWTINNTTQNNKIILHDDTNGVEAYYNNTKRLELDSTANRLLDVDVSIENRLIVGSTGGPSAELEVQGASSPEIRLISTDASDPAFYFGDTVDTVRGGMAYDISDNILQLRAYNNTTRFTIGPSPYYVGINAGAGAATHQLVVRKNGGTIANSPSSAYGMLLDSNEADNGIIVNSTTNGYLRFGDAGSSSIGGLSYSHSADELLLRAGGSDSLSITSSLVWSENTNFRAGSTTEYVEVNYASNEKMAVVDNTSTGRPYIAFYNRDAGSNLDRKGYVGYPESTNDNSAMRLVADQGDVILQAQSYAWVFREEGYLDCPREWGVTASCSQSVAAGSTGTTITWSTPSNYGGTYLGNPDSTFTIPVAGYYWVSIYGSTGASYPGAVAFGVSVTGAVSLYYGSYQQSNTFGYVGSNWRTHLSFTRYFPTGTNIFTFRMSNPGTAAVTFTGTLNMRLIYSV